MADLHTCKNPWAMGEPLTCTAALAIPRCCHAQVMVVAWFIATVFFVLCFASPCRSLPSDAALGYFEVGLQLDSCHVSLHSLC